MNGNKSSREQQTGAAARSWSEQERKADSLTDPESHIRVWWSWHVQECGRKDWVEVGGWMEVWEWIMLCFSQKSEAPEPAGAGGQWSAWGNGSEINCVCLSFSQSIRSDFQKTVGASVSLIKINDQRPVTRPLYIAVQFASQPLDKPVHHWKSISHADRAAVNFCLMELEMYLWPTISLIVEADGVYGCFRGKKPSRLRLSWHL